MAVSKMKKLSDFEGEKSIVIAAKVFDTGKIINESKQHKTKRKNIAKN